VKVKDLIEKLKTFDPELDVVIESSNQGYAIDLHWVCINTVEDDESSFCMPFLADDEEKDDDLNYKEVVFLG